MTGPWVQLVRVGTWGATLLSAHTIVNSRLLRGPQGTPPVVCERVNVCIPMRNEAHNAAACLVGVLASQGVEQLCVLVLDDNSSDQTAEIVREIATNDPRVQVLAGAALPTGWLGKPHACAQLGDAADGDVLVFLDADVRVTPDALAHACDLLRRHHFGLVSPYPRQVVGSAGERLVQPLLQWLWLTFVPLRLAERGRPASLTAANGQFLVVDRNAYRSVGGHGVVRNRVVEDVWLARAMKRNGQRVGVVDGTNLAACRMYEGWSELSSGYTKSLWAAFGSPIGAAAICAFLGLSFVVPPVALVVGPRRIGFAGTLAAMIGRVASARRTGANVRDAWMHPGSVVALIGLTGRSVLGHRRGTLTWKGRQLP
jgi:hypothetical protein